MSLSHPTGAKTLQVAAERQGGAARARAQHKHAKFDILCKASRLRFCPAVVESYGLVDVELAKMLERVYTVGQHHSLGLDDWMDRVTAAVQVALHTGNAAVWRAYAQQPPASEQT